MSTKLQLNEQAVNPDAHLAEASDFRSDDVVRVTLDGQLRPVRAEVAPGKKAPKLRKWAANYLPFWDDGFWLAKDRNRQTDETEYSI
jgi:hypothetical protein